MVAQSQRQASTLELKLDGSSRAGGKKMISRSKAEPVYLPLARAGNNFFIGYRNPVTGNQWFWSYTYPDHGGFEFDSVIVPDDELKAGQPRLLTVDNEVVLPAETNIRLLFTSADVIHNWGVPSLGLKLDTVAGRISETWVRINKKGNYYGMCSELCGVNHGFMPIHIKAVSKADFAQWVETANKEFARTGGPAPVRVAEIRARERDD